MHVVIIKNKQTHTHFSNSNSSSGRTGNWERERERETVGVFLSMFLDPVCDDRYAHLPQTHRNTVLSRHHTHSLLPTVSTQSHQLNTYAHEIS